MCDDVGYNGQHGSVTRSDSRGVFMNSKQWATKNNPTSYGCRSLMRGVHHQSMTVFTSCWWFAGVKWYTLSTLVANQKRSRPLDSSCVRGSKLGTSRMGSNPLIQNPVPFLFVRSTFLLYNIEKYGSWIANDIFYFKDVWVFTQIFFERIVNKAFLSGPPFFLRVCSTACGRVWEPQWYRRCSVNCHCLLLQRNISVVHGA